MYPILWLFSVLVFRGMTVPKSSEPQQSWPDYTPVSPSIWDTEPSHSWATSTGSPATPTTVRYHFLVTCLIQIDTSLFLLVFSPFWGVRAVPGPSAGPSGPLAMTPPCTPSALLPPPLFLTWAATLRRPHLPPTT